MNKAFYDVSTTEAEIATQLLVKALITALGYEPVVEVCKEVMSLLEDIWRKVLGTWCS